MHHEHFIRHCLNTAQKRLPFVAPNPMVGACIVVDGKIQASGAHERFGGAHAEVNAIAQIKDKDLLKQAILYISLEPCNHFGKTPPCTQLIVESQIPTVVIASRDPNPLVAGKGVEYLREHGVTVIEDILRDEAQHLNRRFFTYQQKKRPYIILKWAETSDRFIARSDGSSKWISSQESRTLTHQWRSEEQAILVGTTTALVDNPQLTARHVVGENPLRLVIDRSGRLPRDLKIWCGDAPTTCFTNQARTPYASEEIVVINSNTNLLAQILDLLWHRQILSLLIEGGAETINKFIAQDLWDEARIFSSPTRFAEGTPAPNKVALYAKSSKRESLSIADDLLEILFKD